MAVGLLTLEIGLRLYYGIKVGPSALVYGFVEPFDNRTVSKHGDFREGYSTYFPNQKRVDHNPRTGETFNVTINSKGFRGSNYSVDKLPGEIRIITLGASSTFGYGSKDHETYPAILEKSLNSLDTSRKYEVINLGIPHSKVKHIYHLFRNEGLPLAPDIVTYYEGVNDADSPMEGESKEFVVTYVEGKQSIAEFVKNFFEEKIGKFQIAKDAYQFLVRQTMLIRMIDHIRYKGRSVQYVYSNVDAEKNKKKGRGICRIFAKNKRYL